MDSLLAAFALIPFYLLGSFPSGYLIGRAAGVDVRENGSGSVGATNVARTVGRNAGLATLALDVAKGALAVFLSQLVSGAPAFQGCCAVAVVAGHCFSIPPRLKGGKGVATALGVLVATAPFIALLGVLVFGLTFSLTRIVSLASITAAALIPLGALFSGFPDTTVFALIGIAAIVVFRHRANLQRLAAGKEPRLTFAERKR